MSAPSLAIGLDSRSSPLSDAPVIRRRRGRYSTGPGADGSPVPAPSAAETTGAKPMWQASPVAEIPRGYESALKLNDEPAIFLFENYLREPEIEALLGASRNHLKRGLVTTKSGPKRSGTRTGRVARLAHDHTPALNALAHRLSELVEYPLRNAETFQVLHYGEGQEYTPHHDAWNPESEIGRRHLARGGQRMVTCLFYLNNVAEGGGTCFPRLDLEVRALRARMLLFRNCGVGGRARHPDMLHGGLPVERGEKWAASLWFRESTFRPATSPSGQFGRVV